VNQSRIPCLAYNIPEGRVSEDTLDSMPEDFPEHLTRTK
jgi:hypothetical protein